jgi:hypothetical protein
MKIAIALWAAAACGLVSIGVAQNASTNASRLSPEQLLLQEATALAAEDHFEDAWQLLTTPALRGGSGAIASPSKLGWRVATVAGSLRNQSAYAGADEFARFALMRSWTEPGRSLSQSDVAEAGYWCAWLASEILSDRVSALEWIEQASNAAPDSKRIRELKEKLSEAERSFPTR